MVMEGLDEALRGLEVQFDFDVINEQDGIDVVRVSWYAEDVIKVYNKVLRVYKMKFYKDETIRKQILNHGKRVKKVIKDIIVFKKLLPKDRGEEIIKLMNDLDEVGNSLMSV